jgi:nitrite reductase/ring-hydroxylating ferredoxin subunit
MDETSRLTRLRFVCRREDLLDGGIAARFEIRRGDRQLPAFAVAFAGNVHAYVNICPHRGTSLDWQPGEVFDESGLYLICATHGALFEPASGSCIDGPCRGAALSPVRLVVQADEVLLKDDVRALEPEA